MLVAPSDTIRIRGILVGVACQELCWNFAAALQLPAVVRPIAAYVFVQMPERTTHHQWIRKSARFVLVPSGAGFGFHSLIGA